MWNMCQRLFSMSIQIQLLSNEIKQNNNKTERENYIQCDNNCLCMKNCLCMCSLHCKILNAKLYEDLEFFAIFFIIQKSFIWKYSIKTRFLFTAIAYASITIIHHPFQCCFSFCCCFYANVYICRSTTNMFRICDSKLTSFFSIFFASHLLPYLISVKPHFFSAERNSNSTNFVNAFAMVSFWVHSIFSYRTEIGYIINF